MPRRITQSQIELIRQAKINGYSLNEISKLYHIAKSTISLYCRDLYDDIRRQYPTEEDARQRISEQSKTNMHYKKCPNCGKRIRIYYTLCQKCSGTLQHQNGLLLRTDNPTCKYCGKNMTSNGFTSSNKTQWFCDSCNKYQTLPMKGE